MANIDAPRGLTPLRYRSGHAYTGATRRYFVSATAGDLGIGDTVVKVTNSSDAEGFPEVIRATVGAAGTGVITSFEPNRADLSSKGILSANTGYALVADDPDLLFSGQSSSGGTALTITNIGQHIDLITSVSADTLTGRSKDELDTAAVATDNTFILEELVIRADNEVGTNADWVVSFNLHTERNASATSRTEV